MQICNDVDKVKTLQHGHGEWTEAMEVVSGIKMAVKINFISEVGIC